MEIALLGYGKMGKCVEQAAVERGHRIACRMRSNSTSWDEIASADLAIDFSHPDAVFNHLEQCGRHGRNLMIGTTGWQSGLEAAKTMAETFGIGVLYAPNCSIGMHLFLQILDFSAELLNHFEEYDVAGLEMHHAQKKDVPSGTALEMTRRLKRKMERLKEVNFSSVRVGSLTGTHTVLFDSPSDTIRISHETRNREGFAKGAVAAAEWLVGKKGFFTLDDFIQGVLS